MGKDLQITHKRVQHPIGQGFFHSAEIAVGDATPLTYVYDCGAMGKYATARNVCIDAYVAAQGAGTELDLLFVSHVHADHVNGLPRLLAPKTGLKADTIVLPLTEPAERAMAFAAAISLNPHVAEDEFLRAMTIDPGAALSRFSPRQIIYIRRGGREDQPPNSVEPPLISPDGPRVAGREVGTSGSTWKLVGHGTVSPVAAAIANGGQVQVVMPDSLAIAIGSGQLIWLLLPYVDPAVVSQRRKFQSALAKGLKIPFKSIGPWLAAPTNMHALVTVDIDLLKDAYTAVAYDLNVTSLCLYSGPALFNPKGTRRFLDGRHGGAAVQAAGGDDIRLGWLGTADADLKQTYRRSNFLHHYDNLLSQVATMTLPHHGSARNFHKELLGIGADVHIVPAAQYRSWPHPGASVVQSVFSAGKALHVVTSAPVSRSNERVRMVI